MLKVVYVVKLVVTVMPSVEPEISTPPYYLNTTYIPGIRYFELCCI